MIDRRTFLGALAAAPLAKAPAIDVMHEAAKHYSSRNLRDIIFDAPVPIQELLGVTDPINHDALCELLDIPGFRMAGQQVSR